MNSKSHNRLRASALAVAVLGLIAAGQASASGFQLREQSVKNLGKSNAGSIVGKDASNVTLNPAAMVNLDQATVQADFTVIDLSAKFTGGGNVFGAPIAAAALSGGDGGDPGDPTLVPNMSVVFPLHGAFERLTVGASVGSSFGLKTDYEPGWVGRYRALTSDVKTMDLTLSAAYQADDGVSFGIGLIYERAEATLSKSIDFGSAICAQASGGNVAATCFNPAWALYPMFHPGSQDGEFVVSGDTTGIGFVLGAQFAPTDKFAIGFSHRSEIKHDLKGEVDFTVPAAVQAAMGPAAAAYADGPGGARLVTPAVTTVSVKYGVTDSFRVLADYQRTGWTSLDDVTIKRANGTVIGSEDFNWKDTSYWSLGFEYDISEAFTLRAGYGDDESPTNDITRTPRLPDNDRQLFSIGMSWAATPNLSVDAAFQRITIDSPSIGLPPTFTHGGSDFATLVGRYDGHANLYGVSFQYRF